MHQTLFNNLRSQTFLLQFYSHLARGFFNEHELSEINALIEMNIDKLHLMKKIEWDGKYDIILNLITQTSKNIEELKRLMPFKQICEDLVIANYLTINHNFFYEEGILLKDLKEILDIEVLFKNGHMLHDVFNGYYEKNKYRYQVDCLDFLYSAAYYYNEGYDYYYDLKNPILINNTGPFDNKRIPSKEETMFRNFRESYINIIFFIESFINSVGFDAFLAGLANEEIDEYQLKGIDSISKSGYKKYSTLQTKIQNISRIISGSTINTKAYPFENYLNECVELRNQYVHSSPEKGKIKLSIDDWKTKCDTLISKECYAVIDTFWKGCYPNKRFPPIIFNILCGNSFKGHQGKFVKFED